MKEYKKVYSVAALILVVAIIFSTTIAAKDVWAFSGENDSAQSVSKLGDVSVENAAQGPEKESEMQSCAEKESSTMKEDSLAAVGLEQEISIEKMWAAAYESMMYEEELCGDLIVALAVSELERRELELLSEEGDRWVTYHGKRFVMNADDYATLLRIVEAEAPAEDMLGKMLVACVVMNRIYSPDFPNTVNEVVFQKNQFAPVTKRYYWTIPITDSTREAVERVLNGEDVSQGAMYFMQREGARPFAVKWFDETLQFLFKHGGHEFFTEKTQ